LSIAAHDAGNPIVSNGSQQSIGREANNRVFRCGTFYHSTRTSAMELCDNAQYSCTSLVNDQENNWVKGRELPKQIKTVDQRGCACQFQFIVKWEINVCFNIELKKRSGHPFHLSHSKFIDPNLVVLPTRLLTSDQIGKIVHLVNATSNNGSARNYIHGKFGKFISLMKAAYLCRRENGGLNSLRDDIDQMMDNMAKSDKILFVSLSDVPIKDYFDVNSTDCDETTMTMSTTKLFTGHIHYEPINRSSAISSLATQITEERSERNLQKEQALFIAVAWIVKPAFRLFKLCPEVVWLLARCDFPLQQQGISSPYFHFTSFYW
jgi:hypothetical protein